jgi:hypothetical protein
LDNGSITPKGWGGAMDGVPPLGRVAPVIRLGILGEVCLFLGLQALLADVGYKRIWEGDGAVLLLIDLEE